jgi:hypothetical protein
MNETVNFEKQYEGDGAADVIETGDYVRIVEDADIGDEYQRLMYLQDIQAIGVVRREANTGTDILVVEFVQGHFALVRSEIYLVDVDALHGEMEEMMAEEAAEADLPKAQRYLTNQEMTVTIPAMDNHGDYMVNTVIVRLLRYCPTCGAERSAPWQALSYDGSRRLEVDTWRDGCNHFSGYAGHRKEAQENGLNPGYTGQAGYDVREAYVALEPEQFEVSPGEHLYEVEKWTGTMCSLLDIPPHNDDGKPFRLSTLLSEIRQAINEIAAERDTLLARNALLEAKLRPFALAALDVRKHKYVSPDTCELISVWDEEYIYLNKDMSEALQVRHLNDALAVLPDVDGSAANGGEESA